MKQIEIWKDGVLWANVHPTWSNISLLTGVSWHVRLLITSYAEGATENHYGQWRWNWK